MRKPNFGRFFCGDWSHAEEDGVGLVLEGAPTDDAGFIALLQDYSCNPVAAHRILECLKAGETKKTTLRAFLPFANIGQGLELLGVRMTIVAPLPGAGNSDIDSAATGLLVGRDPEKSLSLVAETDRAEVLKRYAEVSKQFARLPVDVGLYGDRNVVNATLADGSKIAMRSTEELAGVARQETANPEVRRRPKM